MVETKQPNPENLRPRESQPIMWLRIACGLVALVLAIVRVFGIQNVDFTTLAFLAFALVVLISDRVKELGFNKDGITLKLAELEQRQRTTEQVVRASSEGTLGGPRTPPPLGKLKAFAPNLASEDPQRGKWGGQSEVGLWRLRASVQPLPASSEFFSVLLEVTTNEAQAERGSVTFHLHPTFSPAVREVPLVAGRAELELLAWGAFTVGAECGEKRVPLELDLARIPGAPRRFRES